MATITKQTIRVDLTPGRVYPVLHVSQGDVGLEALEFYVYQNGQPFTIPSEVAAINIDGMTPVGVFSYPCTWTGNVVTAGLTATMTAERGIDICELALYDATNNKIGTCNFVIAVEESPYTNAHVSTSDMATIMAAASSAQQYELLAKSWAVGDTGIRTGEDTNNSEYWAELSESWAVGDTGKRTGEDTNNSEYWSTVSHQYANTISFKTYDTVAQMKADTGLLDGGVCRTLGYYAANDGGGAFYKVRATAPASYYETLSNGLFAELIADSIVTPEMFGAVGDGTTDDTNAWQAAVDFGSDVKATHKSYKCGTVHITKDIEINCNDATFYSTEDILFDFSGEVITTLTGEANYSANKGYTITNAEYADYSGVAMLRGTNNFEASRDYYTGGFVCSFFEGELTSAYPIDVTGVSIDIIKPIKFVLSNVGDIIHSSPGSHITSVQITYAFESIIKDSNINDNGGYSVYCFDKCLECHVENVTIQQKFPNSSMLYSYLIAFLNSSFCSVSNSYLYNKDWHCITTGDDYLCFHNSVDNCKLYSDLQFAYLDHENAMNTIVRNTVAAGIAVSALGIIENCTIVSNINSYFSCLVRLNASSIKNAAKYTVKNVYFEPDPAATGTYVGVWISASPQTSGNTYYIDDCVFENVKCNIDILCSFRFSFTSGSNYVIDNIYIKDTNLNVILGRHSTEASYVDISNYVLVLSDCNDKNNNLYVTIGSSAYSFNELHILNSKIRDFLGSYVNVILNNFAATGIITSPISGVLRGTGIHSEISVATIKGTSEITISDMRKSAIITYFNMSKSSDGKIYYQRYVSNVMTTIELT